MNDIHYIGFDVHKKTASYCAKTAGGEIVDEGTVASERATLRTGRRRARYWIYDTLEPHAQELAIRFSAH